MCPLKSAGIARHGWAGLAWLALALQELDMGPVRRTDKGVPTLAMAKTISKLCVCVCVCVLVLTMAVCSSTPRLQEREHPHRQGEGQPIAV